MLFFINISSIHCGCIITCFYVHCSVEEMIFNILQLLQRFHKTCIQPFCWYYFVASMLPLYSYLHFYYNAKHIFGWSYKYRDRKYVMWNYPSSIYTKCLHVFTHTERLHKNGERKCRYTVPNLVTTVPANAQTLAGVVPTALHLPPNFVSPLTWRPLTHICISKLTIIGPVNGLAPTIWTNSAILLIESLGINFSGIIRENHRFLFRKRQFNVVWKMAAILSRPQYLMISNRVFADTISFDEI